MSRRLRASKAPRRGRSLRPRSQQQGPSSQPREETREAPKVAEAKAAPVKVAEAKAAPVKVAEAKAPATKAASIPDPEVADTVKVPTEQVREAIAAAEVSSKPKKKGRGKNKAANKARDAKAAPKASPAKAAPKASPAKAAPKASPAKATHAHDRAFEDDVSTVSAQFFRAPEDSFAPVVEEHHHDDHEIHTLSPATLARRGRLRRGVGIAVGVLGVVVIAVLGRAMLNGNTETSLANAAPPQVEETSVEDKPTIDEEPSAPAPDPEPAAADDAEETDADADADDADADDADAEDADADDADAEDADADDADADDADADDADADAVDGKDAAELQKEALSLLNRGKRKEAIEVGKAAIAADPSQALPYLYVGSALQDLGQWKKGVEAYSECVRHATKGPVHECAAMGGRK